jgi:NAD(P)-dependent dehydrogenase (short-subunit alcohol dehydrogenase family)
MDAITRNATASDDLFTLKGSVALVSGASSGIGLHLSNALARAGARVAIAARRKDKIESAADDLVSNGHQAVAVPLDVTKRETIAAAFDAVEGALGPVDVLINNAGVIYIKRFTDQDESQVARLFDTNLKGAFLVAQEAARRMMKLGHGAIVNVASTAGMRAAGFLSSYAASKAAIIRLTEVMALELASKGIRVNAICPGNIETDMHGAFGKDLQESILQRIPQGRFGKPDDLDGAVLLMSSAAGRYITGATLTVDGGQALSWM